MYYRCNSSAQLDTTVLDLCVSPGVHGFAAVIKGMEYALVNIHYIANCADVAQPSLGMLIYFWDLTDQVLSTGKAENLSKKSICLWVFGVCWSFEKWKK